MSDLVAIGEPLIQFNSLTRGPLRYVNLFEKHIAGSEANFCVSFVRMGLTCTMIARVGNDEFGRNIVEWLRGIGVDVSKIKVDNSYTGIYFVQRGYPIHDKSELIYYRKGSAGSKISPDDIDENTVKSAKLVHSTGISLAISESSREAVFKAFDLANEVSLDTNIRLKLWSKEEARKTITNILSYVDILITDPEDSKIITGYDDENKAVNEYKKFGIKTIIYKLGPKGAVLYHEGGRYYHEGIKVNVEDPTGAGDALGGVTIALLLKGFSPEVALRIGIVSSSLVVTVRGDQENIPSFKDIEGFIEG